MHRASDAVMVSIQSKMKHFTASMRDFAAHGENNGKLEQAT